MVQGLRRGAEDDPSHSQRDGIWEVVEIMVPFWAHYFLFVFFGGEGGGGALYTGFKKSPKPSSLNC